MEQKNPPSEISYCSENNCALFGNEDVRKSLSKQCEKLLPFYNKVSDIYEMAQSNPSEINQCLANMGKQIDKINFDKKQSMSVVCGNQAKHGYFQCYDCRVNEMSCYCQQCFEYKLHEGHMFAYVDNDSGACDCGDRSLIKQQGICHKHKIIEQEEINLTQFIQIKKELGFLLCFSINFCINGTISSKNERSLMLLQIVKKMRRICQQSNYYQKLIAQVLISPQNTFFIGTKTIIVRKLIECSWSKILEEELASLITVLNYQQALTLQILPILLKLISTQGLTHGFKAQKYKFFVRQSLAAAGTAEKILTQKNATYFVIQQKQTNLPSALLFDAFYKIFIELHPNLFIKLIILLLEQGSLIKWFNLMHIQGNEQSDKLRMRNSFSFFIYNFFSILQKEKQNLNKYRQHVLHLMRQSFKLMIETKKISSNVLMASSQLFAYSVLVLYDGKIDQQNLFDILYQELYNKYFGSFQKSLQKICELVDILCYNLVYLESKYSPSTLLTSLPLYTISIIITLFDTTNEEGEGFLLTLLKYYDERVEKQEISDLHQSDIKLLWTKQFLQTLKVIVFSIESKFPQINILAEIDKQNHRDDILQIYRELAVIYKDKTKLQFKKAAEIWIDDQILKKFIKEQYDLIKKEEIKFENFISFNSLFCYDEVLTEQKLRFMIKFNRNEQNGQISWLKSKQKEIEIVLQKIKPELNPKQQLQGQKQIYSSFIREYCSTLIALFLQTKFNVLKNELQKIIENEELMSLSLNKQILSYFAEAVKKNRHHNLVQIQNKKNEAQIRKQKKLQDLKQKQKNCVQEYIEYSPKQQEQQNFICIICRLTNEQQPLHYLCHAKTSNIFTKTMLNSDESFVIFTTCGHLIHENCLLNNLQKKKVFGQSYFCFLCKKQSNLRLPLLYSENLEKSFPVIAEQIVTIISLQSEKYKEEKKEQEMCEINQNQQRTPLSRKLLESIFLQFYVYFQLNSSFFKRYMLPILPTLFTILKGCSDPTYISNYSSSKKDCSMKMFAEKIQTNIKQLVSGTFSTQIELLEEEALKEDKQVSEEVLIHEIDNIFQILSGNKHRPMMQIKNIEKCGIYKPPEDLFTLKTNPRQCRHCQKRFDKMKLCFLCDEQACQNCEQQWKQHIFQKHNGTTVSIVVRDGAIRYESSDNYATSRCLYKDFLGESYDSDKIEVKKGEYTLDENQYQKVVEDIMMENINSKLVSQKEQNRANCQVQ